ncbi:MAG: hypothetical protein QNJ92_11185 [Alphaproteobacteria bacterium]|nr:hypothetical protein [Alphaproteobacteria bacterium]
MYKQFGLDLRPVLNVSGGLMLFAALSLGGHAHAQGNDESSETWKVSFVEGPVSVAGGEKTLQEGDQIAAPFDLETGAEGRVILVRDSDTIQVLPESKLLLDPADDQAKRIAFQQPIGAAIFDLEKRPGRSAEVITPWYDAQAVGPTIGVGVTRRGTTIYTALQDGLSKDTTQVLLPLPPGKLLWPSKEVFQPRATGNIAWRENLAALNATRATDVGPVIREDVDRVFTAEEEDTVREDDEEPTDAQGIQWRVTVVAAASEAGSEPDSDPGPGDDPGDGDGDGDSGESGSSPDPGPGPDPGPDPDNGGKGGKGGKGGDGHGRGGGHGHGHAHGPRGGGGQDGHGRGGGDEGHAGDGGPGN